MIAVYSQKITPRLEYSLDTFLTDLLGLKYQIVTDKQIFIEQKGAKLNYSDDDFEGFWIRSSSLLFEDDIRQTDPYYEFDTEHLFITKGEPFDPFAAAFYLISRYEEYLPFEADEHGRFPASESILSRYSILKQPVVNKWALELRDQLKDFYPNLLFQPRKFDFRSTIDIDQAFKYKHKGWKRNLGGLLRDVKNGDGNLVFERINVLSGTTDPFNNFDWQNEIHDKYESKVNYFIQVGERDEFDKNLEPENPHFAKIIKGLAIVEW